MKSKGLYRAFSVSVLLHILTVVTALFIASLSIVPKAPIPYVVSLVSESPEMPRPASTTAARESTAKVREPANVKEPARTKEPEKAPPRKEPAKPAPQVKEIAPKKEDESRVREMIESIQAKKRLEKVAALRKMIDVGPSAAQVAKNTPSGTPEQKGSGALKGADYYSLVVGRIRQQWVFPGSIERDLEAIVSISIARDGRVTINRVEKSSGNALFDRSVLRAINLASPLPPPPQEMDIGVRFRP
ncbi:MAG TPA: TonB family protein [Dissulfurispiraceae bacterium]|nr:TonB family protein [Dissulfurispiraceae bacterium]